MAEAALKQTVDEFIERKILIGLATSTDYARVISRVFKSELLDAPAARMIAAWCLQYFERYEKAPGRELETIFVRESERLPRADAAETAEILESLSEEFEETPPDAKTLFDETVDFFRRQQLRQFSETIRSASERGDLEEAEKIAAGFTPLTRDGSTWVDPFSSFSVVKSAFKARERPLIQFGKALGRFLDRQFTRDAFVAFLSPEKRGKSWLLLEIALRSLLGGSNVVFFQAGDMSETQQLLRLYTRITGKPAPSEMIVTDDEEEDLTRHPSVLWIPQVDCLSNQFNTCVKEEREENGDALFDETEYREIREEEKLSDVLRERTLKDWSPCHNCSEIRPAVFLRQLPRPKAFDAREAYRVAKRWQKKYKKQFRLSTHVNESLSVSHIRSLLDTWEKEDGFRPDVIVIDYADILAADPDFSRMDWRHQINKTWQRLRALSEQRHCLVVTATQAAASSYNKKLITLKDFSEDKRKYAHVTAMYGINQTPEEKGLGIMRLNPLVIREGEFNEKSQVHVLQNFALGRAVVGSW